MNLAIIGLGSMGTKIKEIAENRGHIVNVTIDPLNPKATHQKIKDADLSKVDVVIDFSNRDAVIDNALICASFKKNLIIGTTGWYEKTEEIKKIAEENNIGILWSANFSIGVNLYYKIIENASKLINEYDEYDIWGTELHHNNKADSPSGTTKDIAKILLENIDRKDEIIYDRLDRKIKPNEINISSTRGGAINFSHTIAFDSLSDTITLIHNARDRGGYALGAVKATEWLNGKTGFFNMKDFLNNK